MNILFYYSVELVHRSKRFEPFEEAARSADHNCFCYWREKGGLNVIPFAPDAVLVRTSHSGTDEDYRNLETFSRSGVPVINSVAAVKLASDKSSYYGTLKERQVPLPDYITYESDADAGAGAALDFIERHGFPVVGKNPFSSQGRAVELLESWQDIRCFHAEQNGKIILQQFVAESAGRHIRSVVVGKDVVLAHANESSKGDFRSNLKRGATFSLIECTQEIRNISLAATHAVGLDIAGIDLLYGKKGLQVCDVNANPGLMSYLSIGIDLFASIVKYTEAKAQAHAPMLKPQAITEQSRLGGFAPG